MKNVIRFFSACFLALTLLTVAGCASSAKQEGTGEYIDDSVITSKVKSALLADPNINSNEITVETYKGVVQLSGFVSSRGEITRALDLARGVQGVKSVKNDMRLK